MPRASSRASSLAAGATPVGVRTEPKGDGRQKGHGKDNVPATRRWHQGFGTIRINGHWAVPFATEQTCRRIARRAEAVTKPTIIVFKHNDLWCYREEQS